MHVTTAVHKDKGVRAVSRLGTWAHKEAREMHDHLHLPVLSADLRGSMAFKTSAQFIAGSFGGASATYATHWLDTVKVRMQSYPGVYRSATSCLRITLKEEGVRALYQGATPSIFACTTRAAVVFSCYGLCQEVVERSTGVKRTNFLAWHHAYTGGVTGILSGIILCPIELLKCRLQASQHSQMKPLSLMKDICCTEGFTGMFRGLTATWAKMIPCSFIYFGSYEQSKTVCRRWMEKDVLGPVNLFLCGGVAGICSSVVFPIDVIKTRVQVMTPETRGQGIIPTVAMVVKTEGLKSLCSGLKPFLLRTCLFSAIQLLVYEQIKAAMLT